MKQLERKKNRTSSKINLGVKIGSGTFGSVYRVKNRHGTVAKIYVQDESDIINCTRVREWAALTALASCSPFVHPMNLQFTKRYGPVLLMEEFQGDLSDLIVRNVGDIPNVLFQVLCGLLCMQNRNLMHRDLKGHNILTRTSVSGKIRVGICDFGSCCFINSVTWRKTTEKVCTVTHRAPEVLEGLPVYTEKIDTWAAGVIAAEMYLPRNHMFWTPGDEGSTPMESETEKEEELQTLTEIKKCLTSPCGWNLEHQIHWRRMAGNEWGNEIKTPPGINREPIISHPSTLPSRLTEYTFPGHARPIPAPPDVDMMNVICRLLTLDPADRPSVSDIMTDPLFSKFSFSETEISDPLSRLRLMEVHLNMPCYHPDRQHLVHMMYLISLNMNWQNPHSFFAGVQICDVFLSSGTWFISLSMVSVAIGVLVEAMFEGHLHRHKTWIKRHPLKGKCGKKDIRKVVHMIEDVLRHRLFFTSEWMYLDHFCGEFPDSVRSLATNLMSMVVCHAEHRKYPKEAQARAVVALACETQSVSHALDCSGSCRAYVAHCCGTTTDSMLLLELARLIP